MKSTKHFGSYILVFLVASALAVLISLGAQPGGINRINAFIAPIIGPWSKCLPPNSAELTAQELHTFSIYTFLFIVIVLFSSIASYYLKNRWIRIIVKLIGYVVIATWCLRGIGKVLSELI